MATTNSERIGKALEALLNGLLPFVEREMKAHFKGHWLEATKDSLRLDRITDAKPGEVNWDVQATLAVMKNHWNTVFKKTLGHAERSLVFELVEVRNKWAHQNGFSSDDTYRALDSIQRLLESCMAMEAREVAEMKQQLLRVQYDEQARAKTRVSSATAVQGAPDAALKPWREIATPHEDVASGRYQQAEFAADLSQVYRGEGSSEYRDPEEFFRRTFPTNGLQDLLTDSLLRLTGKGGNPVIKLQTNFGGGKTHSMIALYHLFSGVQAKDLAGIEQIAQQAKVEELPKANRAVLVGIALGPAQVTKKEDGTEVHTLWGEMAYQLLGKKGYQLVEEADRKGVSPGSDVLRELFNKAAPCLILIDEWIAYVRMLYGKDDLPGGSFDSNLTFAQALTEAARATRGTQVVATIPISPRVSEQYRDQIEVGGEAGMEALVRLERVFARMESPWRPASAEESFEIVRRRLFEPITDHVAKDAVVRRFHDHYKENAQEFPSECKETDYRRRMESAYPIHPELFDRLYQDWSSLEQFQLTRGVLRLMAAVINSLWMRNDASPMILPSMVPLDDDNVRRELTRYLEGPWDTVVERDIDGPKSVSLSIDGHNKNLGKYSACRRVARTVFIGSAPTLGAANRGIEMNRIKLGCAQPGETVAIFGDAMRYLTDKATHLYVDQSRYWYATQPSVTRLAQDRAQQYKIDVLHAEIIDRLRHNHGQKGGFAGVHMCPDSSVDVADEMKTRLVILSPSECHIQKDDTSPAMSMAKDILEHRGTIPRNYRNTLVFLAPDKTRLQDLEGAVGQYLAWKSIIEEQEGLNLDAFQRSQAKKKIKDAEETLEQRIPETYQWVLYPSQGGPQKPVEWQAVKVQGTDALAERVSNRLTKDGQFTTQYAGILLRIELDKIPLWQADAEHVKVSQLAEYFAKYLYLPRLQSSDTLAKAIEDGLANLSWSTETFAYANLHNEGSGRYEGLKAGQGAMVRLDSDDLLVKPERALKQLEADREAASGTTGQPGIPEVDGGGPGSVPGEGGKTGSDPGEPKPKVIRRFFATAKLDSNRLGRDAGNIATEVLQHLTGLVGADVEVSIEIRASFPDGVPDNVVRTVTENCRTLKFEPFGFEEE